MSESNSSTYVIEVCTAIITENQQSAMKLLEKSKSKALPMDLRNELIEVARVRPGPVMSGVVRLSYYLPAWMQFIGQRMVLVSPRFGYWVLRKTKLHHRWY